jgi:hypothetical protein
MTTTTTTTTKILSARQLKRQDTHKTSAHNTGSGYSNTNSIRKPFQPPPTGASALASLSVDKSLVYSRTQQTHQHSNEPSYRPGAVGDNDVGHQNTYRQHTHNHIKKKQEKNTVLKKKKLKEVPG